MSELGWRRAFEDPIELPDGRVLVTLLDAATHITELPKKEAAEPEWQTAIETLMRAAERSGICRFDFHISRRFDRGLSPAAE